MERVTSTHKGSAIYLGSHIRGDIDTNDTCQEKVPAAKVEE